MQRYPAPRHGAIVGLLVEIRDYFLLKLFHVDRRFYSAGRRNNMFCEAWTTSRIAATRISRIAARCRAADAAPAICRIR